MSNPFTDYFNYAEVAFAAYAANLGNEDRAGRIALLERAGMSTVRATLFVDQYEVIE